MNKFDDNVQASTEFDIDSANQIEAETSNLIEKATENWDKKTEEDTYRVETSTMPVNGGGGGGIIVNSPTTPTLPPNACQLYMSSARIIPIEYYMQNYNPKDVTVPKWEHLGVSTVDTRKIAFDDIYIVSDTVGDKGENITRAERHTSSEIENLRQSFGRGVDTHEAPPAVIEVPLEDRAMYNGKRYKLVYGYGRSEAIKHFVKYYFFSVLNGTQDKIEDVMAAENEGPLPKRVNTEADMINFLQRKLSGGLANTEEALREKFVQIYPNQPLSMQNKVVAEVMKLNNTPIIHFSYTSKIHIKDWLVNYCDLNWSKNPHVFNGEYDPDLERCCVVAKSGYAWKNLVAAVQRYHKHGYKTYVFGYISAPDNNSSYKEERKAYLKEWDDLKPPFRSCGMKDENWPVEVYGFLPQQVNKEDMTKIIPASKYR